MDNVEQVEQDVTFAHAYVFRVLQERPGTAVPTYYFPGARTDGGRDGLLVRIAPDGAAAWVGVFAFGEAWRGKTGVYTHPDARSICVVCRGDGYVVRVDQPTRQHEVLAHPVFDVRAIPALGLLVFVDYTELVAYGAAGLVWRSGRLGLDRVRIMDIVADRIHARTNGWDGDIIDVDVVVDARTGRHDHDDASHLW